MEKEIEVKLLPDGFYYGVGNSEIKEGDIVKILYTIGKIDNIKYPAIGGSPSKTCVIVNRDSSTACLIKDCQKVLFSTNPELKEIPFLVLTPDVEQLANKANGYSYYAGKDTHLNGKQLAFKEGFIEGYKAAQAKEFTEEQVRKAFEAGRKFGKYHGVNEQHPDMDQFIQCLRPVIKSMVVEMEEVQHDGYKNATCEFIQLPYGCTREVCICYHFEIKTTSDNKVIPLKINY